jgi:uncharacterized Zn finger protein
VLSYFDLVPEASESELLQVHFAKITPGGILPGIYAFTEHFCDCPDYSCPCVMIEVYREAVGCCPEDPVAVFTFNFAEKKTWFGMVKWLEATEFELDPYTDQAPYAEALMKYWGQLLESDSNFAYRV